MNIKWSGSPVASQTGVPQRLPAGMRERPGRSKSTDADAEKTKPKSLSFGAYNVILEADTGLPNIRWRSTLESLLL